MFRTRMLAAGLAALALAVTPALAQEQVQPKDYQIFKAVAQSVQAYPMYTIFDDIGASVDNGVVTLVGKVTMPYKREELAKRISRVKGVVKVENRIDVLPVSRFDEELRYRIARAIYGNSSFWQYASMANPPIHIVVENGRVTLTGVVNSNVERMLARSLATSFGAFSVTNDLKTDAEMNGVLDGLGHGQ
jgi:osmotically-inducible protein OsmY